MCHPIGSLIRADRGDLDPRQVLAMTALPVRVLAPLLLEGDDLVRALLRDDLARHGGAREKWRADLGACPQHLPERDRGARLAGKTADLEHVAFCDLVLLAAGADDREHGEVLQ